MEINNKDLLADIVVKSGIKKNSIFRKYKAKEIIGKEIFKCFEKYTNNDGIFYLSEQDESVGIITISQAVISLSLLSQFGVSIDEKGKLKKAFEKNLSQLFKDLNYSDNRNTLNFVPTPYLQDDIDFNLSYTDTIAKCLQAFMEARELIYFANENNNPLNLKIDSIGSDNEILEAITRCIKICIKTLSQLAIKKEHSEKIFNYNNKTISFECNYKGWNFTNLKYLDNSEVQEMEPSLYFTYSVAVAYISIYENILEALRYKRLITDEEKKEFKPICTKEKFIRDLKFYETIEAEYLEFKTIMKASGYYLDKKLDLVDIKQDYLGLDYTSIDYKDILGSTTNNALFNTLFSVIILIASGVADDYEEYMPQERYFEWLQSATQNVYDCYCDLDKANKLYIVEQYTLNFNELILPDLNKYASYLRKQRIQSLSLVPLMIRSYNLVSQYLIQYPQKQMINYLELIMKSRYTNKNSEREWLWDKDGYDININTVFISSLFDFYSYYEQFEAPYISTEATIAQKEKENDLLIEKTIRENKKIIEEKNSEIEKVIYEKNNLDIVKGVKEIAKEVLQEQLIKLLPDILKKVTNYLGERKTDFSILDNDDVIDEIYQDEKVLAQAFLELIVGYFSKELFGHVGKERGKYKLEKDEIINNENKGLVDFVGYKEKADLLISILRDTLSVTDKLKEEK